MALSDGLVSEDDLARDLGIPIATQRTWRCHRKGPPWIKVGRKVLYRRASVERWLNEREIDPDKLNAGRRKQGAA